MSVFESAFYLGCGTVQNKMGVNIATKE